jgi:hypothetical protein
MGSAVTGARKIEKPTVPAVSRGAIFCAIPILQDCAMEIFWRNESLCIKPESQQEREALMVLWGANATKRLPLSNGFDGHGSSDGLDVNHTAD